MRPRKPAPEPVPPAKTPSPAPARPLAWASRRLVAALLAGAIVLGGVAAVTYRDYASVHLREPPKVPRCVFAARRNLKKPATISGTEPRETDTGETVYLTGVEDRAVGCALMIAEPLARRLAGALGEHDPARRATKLHELLRDHTPPDPAHDRQAYATYVMASNALQALPQELPEVKAAFKEMSQLHACRFALKDPCPTRPPIPTLVWIAGVPAAACLLAVTGIGAAAGVIAFRGWLDRRRRRKPRKKDGATTEAVKNPEESDAEDDLPSHEEGDADS